MSDYEYSLIVNAAPEQVFNFVSNVRNLPKYLPTVRHAEPQGGDRVRVQGEAQGRLYDNDGFFRVDERQRRMEWGSDGEHEYRGWLDVAPGADGGASSIITVRLQFEPRGETAQQLDRQTGDRDLTIQQGLQQALESIKNVFEGHDGKIEPMTAKQK